MLKRVNGHMYLVQRVNSPNWTNGLAIHLLVSLIHVVRSVIWRFVFSKS